MSDVVGINRQGVTCLITMIINSALPSLFTDLDGYDGADAITASHIRSISTRQLFVLKLFRLAEDGHHLVAAEIFNRMTPRTLGVLHSLYDFEEPSPSEEVLSRVVMAVAIGYVTFFHTMPIRPYLCDHLGLSNVVYAADLANRHPQERVLCYTSVDLSRASGGRHNFSQLPLFDHLF